MKKLFKFLLWIFVAVGIAGAAIYLYARQTGKAVLGITVTK